MCDVAVIGCGVISLTSAISIQKRLKNVKVTIFTKDVSPNTTSDIAAGYWMPYLLGDTPPDKVNKWSKDTYDYVLKLWKKGKAKKAGVSLQHSHCLSDRKDLGIPDWSIFVLGFSVLSREYLDKLGNLCKRNFVSGFEFVTFMWEASIFLPFLEQKFLKNGGKIVRNTIENFNELQNFDVIVNCTGLNAKKLTDDSEIQPYRGQIARVFAPWQFQTFIVDSEHDTSCYIIPNRDSVILGGTSQPVYDTEVNNVDTKNIFRNCSELVPALSSAEVIKHQVGLRPGRQRVRLEIEIKSSGKNEPLRIVHNYGHGGAGITLSIGCARECAELVQRAMDHRNLKSRM